MIEKMKFLSITGPKADIDRVVNQYLAKYEIHLENAMAQLNQVQNLSPFIQINPYKEVLAKAEEFTGLLGEEKQLKLRDISLEEATELIDRLGSELSEINVKCEEENKKRTKIVEDLNLVSPFLKLPGDIDQLVHYRFVQVRFGRIAREYYEKFKAYVYDSLDTWFYPCHEDEYVWGVYFVPWTRMEEVDAVFSSLHFERIYLKKDYYYGTPQEIYDKLRVELNAVDKKIAEYKSQASELLKKDAVSVFSAKEKLSALSVNFDVRKVAACVKEHHETFYILCGWMAEEDSIAFAKEIENDANLFCIIEDDKYNINVQPPTKLKNPKIFKPFEMYVEMYGLPSYNEIDPTILIGITYSILFGFMFGDAGQGLCLLIGGFLLYRFKKMRLAGIISCCGFFSTIFGVLFGSVFGFEDIIDAVWLRPQEAMTDLPFIGKLNTVFVVAIAIGMGIILLCMILNIINSVKEHNTEKTWFDTNGAAGLVFYFALAAVIVLYMSGNALPATIVLTVLFIIPLLLMFFKEPLSAIIEKKAQKMEGGVGMFITQGVFELFEVLLSYFSNTLSFVRVGAFAVSHAAMMQVVLMLAGAEAGSPNWAVVIGGNLFVCGMEGLIVGIQVLRLEYYELFSRFYRGSGRAFEPYGKH